MTEQDRLLTLPPEVIHYILKYLSFRECILITRVNKAWRSLVLNWPELWSCLSTRDGHTIVPHLLPFGQYIHPSSIKRLRLDEYDIKNADQTGDWVAHAIQFLVTQKCDSIKNVSITVGYRANFDLLKLITACSSILTHISIVQHKRLSGCMMDTNVITPAFLLQHCPNLVKLLFVAPIDYLEKANGVQILEEDLTDRLTDIKRQRLVDLAIYIPNAEHNSISERCLVSILQIAPRLRHIALALYQIKFPIAALSALLQHHSPELTSIVLVDDEYGQVNLTVFNSSFSSTPPADDEQPHSGSGVKDIVLHDHSSDSRDIHFQLRQLVLNYHNTLRTLDLSGNGVLRQDVMDHLLRSTSNSILMPCLTRLTLGSRSVDTSSDTLCRFVSQAIPNLAYLRLRDYVCHDECSITDDEVLLAFTTAGHLNELVLDRCRVSKAGLLDFLDRRTMSATRAAGATASYVLIDRMAIYHCWNIATEDIEEFLDAMIHMQKALVELDLTLYIDENLEWDSDTRNEYFFGSNEGKILFEKLNSVAKTWKVKLYFGDSDDDDDIVIVEHRSKYKDIFL